jgi:hypothetical protein
MAPQAYQLVMRTGPNPGKVFELGKNEIFIGRDANNDIVINDAEVSRKHARLLMTAGGYVLEDLGSTNGSFVNGQRLMGPHVLRPGETVMLGENVSLTLEVSYDPDATMAAGVAPAGPPQTLIQSPPVSYAQPAREAYTPPPPKQAPTTPPPVYSGQIPSGPAEPYIEPEAPPRRINRNLLYAGAGCLILVICGCLAGTVVFDTLNMYCTPPFDAIFSFLYACP